MIWIRRMLVTLMLIGTLSLVWWEIHDSPVVRETKWFKANIESTSKENNALIKRNLRIQQKIIALRYDHRVIEQEARKQLSFSRRGEITLILKP